MLEPIEGLADGTIGFRASGKIEADDYRNVMNPALDAVLSQHDKVNFVYVVGPDFDGLAMGAWWEDTKEAARGFSVWNRIAFVSDVGWMKHIAPTASHVIPGEVRVFPLAEEVAAIAWASDGS